MNKKLQNFMYTMLSDPHPIAAKKSLDVMIELYRKNVWQDSKTVNVISQALFSDNSKLKACALQFFLGADEDPLEDEEGGDQDHGKTYQQMLQNKTAKLTHKKKSLLKKQLSREKKKERTNNKAPIINTSALHLLHDAQGLAEKLFKNLKAAKDRCEFILALELPIVLHSWPAHANVR